jgi:hypothetical protein
MAERGVSESRAKSNELLNIVERDIHEMSTC